MSDDGDGWTAVHHKKGSKDFRNRDGPQPPSPRPPQQQRQRTSGQSAQTNWRPQGSQEGRRSSQSTERAISFQTNRGGYDPQREEFPTLPVGRRPSMTSSTASSLASSSNGSPRAVQRPVEYAQQFVPGLSGDRGMGSGGQVNQGATQPLLRSDTRSDTKMDPSSVLPSSRDETQASERNDEMSVADFVMLRCQNVVRISANNNPQFHNERQKMEEDLKTYLDYNLGLKALLPSRPRKENINIGRNYKVVANHFQITMREDTNILVYKIQFGNEDENKMFGGPGSKGLSGTFTEYNNKAMWEKIVREYGHVPNGMNGVRAVYDGGTYLVSNRPFAWRKEELQNGVTLVSRDGAVKVKITSRTDAINMDNFRNFLNNTRRSTFPKDVVLFVLNVVREFCATRGYIPSDRYYFEKAGGTEMDGDKGNLLVAKTGYFHSVRVLDGGLQLNVDAMKAVFYKPGVKLIDAWERMVGHYIQHDERETFNHSSNYKQRNWNNDQVRIANRYLKNLQINSSHRRAAGTNGERINDWRREEQFSVFRVTPSPANLTQVIGDYSFNGIYNRYTPETPFRGHLIQFMSERYPGLTELLDNLPAIKVSKIKDQYLPWGCCFTSNASRYGSQIDARLTRNLVKGPDERSRDIGKWMANRLEDGDDWNDRRPWAEKLFDVQVSKDMIQVDALLLTKPYLVMSAITPEEGARREQRVVYYMERKWFDIGSLHMLQPTTIAQWAMLVFDRQGSCNDQWVGEFMEKLQSQMTVRGLRYAPLQQTIYHDIGHERATPAQRQQALKVALQNLFGRLPKPTFLICFMSRRLTPEYATLKSECDRTYGVPTQVVISKWINNSGNPGSYRGLSRNSGNFRNSGNYNEVTPLQSANAKMIPLIENLLWKINVKCGGLNFRVGSMEDIDIMRLEQNTILMGADVTHGSPSIAAVVATTDYRAVNYATRIRAQKSNQEQIEHLQSMVEQLLEVYHDTTEKWPDHIIFFRDGISETQYLDTLRYEGTQILKAAREKYGRLKQPKLFIILAIKRHHTRFFTKMDRQRVAAFTNIRDGTVVDEGVTHPREYEFFLLSHIAVGNGTARPTKYHVLVDQIPLKPRDLYRLIYFLCFSFQRCLKAVALVTPVNYAHFAAFRAKLYMDSYVIAHPKPAPDNRQAYANWLTGALGEDLNAHTNLRNRLWYA